MKSQAQFKSAMVRYASPLMGLGLDLKKRDLNLYFVISTSKCIYTCTLKVKASIHSTHMIQALFGIFLVLLIKSQRTKLGFPTIMKINLLQILIHTLYFTNMKYIESISKSWRVVHWKTKQPTIITITDPNWMDSQQLCSQPKKRKLK